jgi:hypothetical protein
MYIDRLRNYSILISSYAILSEYFHTRQGDILEYYKP